MVTRILILFIYLLTAGLVHAQEPVIFKVRKPITILPESDYLWANRDNEICLSVERKMDIKIEPAGTSALISPKGNGYYSIRINCDLRKGRDVVCPDELTLIFRETDDLKGTGIRKKYKLLSSMGTSESYE